MAFIESFYGRSSSSSRSSTQKQSADTAPASSWRLLKTLLVNEESFSNSETVFNRTMVGFYGNHGVCMFKFFVSPDDPQQIYSLAILTLDLACFVVISVNYVLIHRVASGSRATAGASNRANQGALDRKISLIITSDFLCWVPFIVTCWLHYTQVG